MYQEVVYVTAGRVTQVFEQICLERFIPFTLENSVRSPDESTLFCTAGMQRFKTLFTDEQYVGTTANIQRCLRTNDLDEIGDATHYLSFSMIGLFSFREMTLADAIDFWLSFLERLDLLPDHVTIHPDRLDAWTLLYRGRVPVIADPDCQWSDGTLRSYCTEFYRDGVEIGNIVHPLDTCIDSGFGLERIANLLEQREAPNTVEILRDAIDAIIDAGFRPGPKQQGYVLRRLIRRFLREGGSHSHIFVQDEQQRLDRTHARYSRLQRRHADMPAEWWWDTHGIDLEEVRG